MNPLPQLPKDVADRLTTRIRLHRRAMVSPAKLKALQKHLAGRPRPVRPIADLIHKVNRAI